MRTDIRHTVRACVRVQVRESTTSSGAADREVTEQRITVMLISVVVVFLVCQLPQAIQKLYTVYVASTPGAFTAERRLRLAIGGNVCNLLVIVNSAVNFVLYSALSVKFRQTFRRTFCRWCRAGAGGGGGGTARRRSSASVVGATQTAAVPLTTAVDDETRPPLPATNRRLRRTASTDDQLVTADTSSHTVLDGAAAALSS